MNKADLSRKAFRKLSQIFIFFKLDIDIYFDCVYPISHKQRRFGEIRGAFFIFPNVYEMEHMKENSERSVPVMAHSIPEIYGSLVFNDKIMREKLPKDIYKALRKTIENETHLELDVANSVAVAMK
jgi:hypothetical protein